MIQLEAIKAKLCSNGCTNAVGYEAHFVNLRKNGTQQSRNRNLSQCWRFRFLLYSLEPCYWVPTFVQWHKTGETLLCWVGRFYLVRSNRTCAEAGGHLGKQID